MAATLVQRDILIIKYLRVLIILMLNLKAALFILWLVLKQVLISRIK